MIWIENAYRYRDPDRDLPKDFEERREYYYQMMGLPLNPYEFIKPLRDEQHEKLKELNETIANNDKVKITNKDGGRIKITPSEPQADPPNIKKLHREIQKQWSTINLIDILKESELQIDFSELFHTVASKEKIPKDKLLQRLLLCLYAIGTNTGLKRISAANESVSYSDLRYIKRRFVNVPNVRAAIVKIVNKILKVRDPRIWGEATTGVACDSKKISVWDQNLMAEWHARYKGRGVMVYWHVDKKSLCIYSQLKTCSSSEVGSMLKGILQHSTDMLINEAYVDTHGQSTIGFGVSEMLHFDLLPRLKNINKQKLYYPSSSKRNEYDNLDDILKGPINWKLIEDYYDEVVKHMVALKTGMVEPDVFIKRFSNDNYQHPVYRALVEIGKATKTIFLCRYLMSEELRIEIHESQNVVERVNSIMGFIFYGKLGEISTNVKDDQELAIVCLHLLQACMSYINTLIIQDILSKPKWQNVLTLEDKRALTVLIHAHINPYGLFPLDLQKRLGITVQGSNIADEVGVIRIKEPQEAALA
jgi:TnpA family transposase